MQLVNRDSYHNDLELKRSPFANSSGCKISIKTWCGNEFKIIKFAYEIVVNKTLCPFHC